MAKVKIDQEKCIGCGSCQAVCPEVFELGEDNKAHFKETGSNEGEVNHECVKEGAEICPVEAIELIPG